MARKRSPQRDQARKIWLDSSGTMTIKQVADAVNVTPAQIRKWKSVDQWQDALEEQQEKKKRGGQPGNKNASGSGAPCGNKNAETHGAYSTVCLADLPEEQQEYIKNLTLETKTNLLNELKALVIKEADLQGKIKQLENDNPDNLYVDKVIQMLVPRSRSKRADETQDTDDPDGKSGAYKTAMRTVINSSAFDRSMKLQAESNRIHGRIIKLLDSIRSYEMECRRADLEERKYQLSDG